MNYNQWQRCTGARHRCAACKKKPKHQTHCDIRETTAKSLAPIQSIASLHTCSDRSKRESHKPPGLSTDRQLGKNRDVERDNLSRSGPSILPYSQPSLSSLRSRCKSLAQENAAMLKKIIEMEDQSMKSASQKLQQYDRAGSNIHAVQLWADRQIRDARRDLEVIREKKEERMNVLRLQLQDCEEMLKDAQEKLKRLREYWDREHSVKVLQAAELERQLRVLNETHQDHAADVEALVQTDIQNLLESQQKVKESALQTVVEQHMESLPLSLRRLCLQNKEMKQDIHAYQQMVAKLQDEVLNLLQTGDVLRKSWKEETERLCRDLLLNKPSCSPNEDVVLDIPVNLQLPI